MQNNFLLSEENRILVTKTFIKDLAERNFGLFLNDGQVDEIEGIMLDRLGLFTLACIRESIKNN